MQPYIITAVFALFFAVTVHARDETVHVRCFFKAYDFCNQDRSALKSVPWHIVYYKCQKPFWLTLASDDKCPHPGVGCRCYNGCVKDRSDVERDVGGYCTNACNLTLLKPTRPCIP